MSTIPVGYKQTEVGVIPEDWEALRVCEFSSVVTGGTPKTEIREFWNGDYPWITPDVPPVSVALGFGVRG